MVSSLTRFDLTKEENILLIVCSKAVESELVNLETSHTVILNPMLRSICEQSYKHFTLINYDSRVVPDLKILLSTTLES